MPMPRSITDRPFLRLFTPDVTDDLGWTMQRAFDELRWPELQHKRSSTDGQRWLRLWHEFEVDLRAALASPARTYTESPEPQSQRITYPLAQNYPMQISQITNREIKAFHAWLIERFPLPGGASSVNKAIGEITLVLRLAADEGIEVQRVTPPRRIREQARPRYYLDAESIEKLWAAAEQMQWPTKTATRTFGGTAMHAGMWWQALLILLRTYGMRVQDLAAYEKCKKPILWSQVYFGDRSPNPESLETWPLGWMYYRAAKTSESSGREFYLPLTPAARGAIDRLRAASERMDGRLDLSAPIFRVPRGHGVTEKWKSLQDAASVRTRSGSYYELEDFRKTVATYAAPVHAELAGALCGWGGNGGIKHRHYQQPEPLLVRYLCRVPMPACFSQWIDPAHQSLVDRQLATY